MTDNEIIKALGYCKRSVGAILCTRECPMYSECDSEDPMVDICGLAIDLINRQKAEIERLQDELHRAKVEISKHFDYMDEAKSEAIKEFADRLCDGRVSNDSVVIAVKAELEMQERGKENDRA